MRGTSPLAALFGRSPFGPLQEHMKKVLECAEQIEPLFAALKRQDLEAARACRDRVFELEHEADALHDNIRGHLPRSLFLPVDRRDLLDLLSAQDSIADAAQDVASLAVARRLAVPDEMAEEFAALIGSTLATTRACGDVIAEMDELLETGFRGRQAGRVEKMITTVDELESKADGHGLALTRILFENEERMTPLEVVFWYELLRIIGDIADNAESVGDRLRLLIAR